MKPTQSQIDTWNSIEHLMPFNASGIRALVPIDIDPIPIVEDGKGQGKDGKARVVLDGWTIAWEGTVQPDWANLTGNLHGAAAAWIVDVCTSAAMMTHSTETFWGPPMPSGVSLALNMTYMNPAKVGTEIIVKTTIQKCSLTSANLSCEIIDKHSGKLYATGTHLKAWRPARSKL